MKVLNLRCSHHHSFEGWFGSEDDFQNQLKRSLIECPMCADSSIQKMPSAPRLNFGGHRDRGTDAANEAQNTPSTSTAVAPLAHADARSDASEIDQQGNAMSQVAQANFLNALRHVVAHTEDVGQRFADEARRMHYGEVEGRSIRGQASARETVELLEEGIEVLPLPLLPMLKETLQ